MPLQVDIEKKLGSFTLGVSFAAGNETLALLGASGSGKSMTLKCIAGIETPHRGRIVADGVTLYDSKRHINLPPQSRRVGLLFQNYALFPHMTVRQNLWAGGCRERDRNRRAADSAELLERFGLTHLAERLPSQLSGGEQQRTALARILMSRPHVLLLDEPFSALDPHLRFRMEQEMREILRAFGKTVILVSHHRDEVYRMADKVAILNRGGVEVCGEKEAVFRHPETRTAALLTGYENISRLERWDSSRDNLWNGLRDAFRDDAQHSCRAFAVDWGVNLTLPCPPGDARYVGIRSRDICLGAGWDGRNASRENVSRENLSGENIFWCRVADVVENPFTCTVMLSPLAAVGNSRIPIGWEVDRNVWNTLRADMVHVYLPPASLLLLRE